MDKADAGNLNTHLRLLFRSRGVPRRGWADPLPTSTPWRRWHAKRHGWSHSTPSIRTTRPTFASTVARISPRSSRTRNL